MTSAPSQKSGMSFRSLVKRLDRLYHGNSETAQRFRYILLSFDIATILFIVLTSFVPQTDLIEYIDIVIGIMLLADLAARFAVAAHPWRELLRPTVWADIVSILSFLAPIAGEGAGFLRILRTLRLLHTYQLLSRLRSDSQFFRRNEDVILAAAHLVVFIFIMTGLVYETQHWTNPAISNYMDALYFTVTALTTTGFGDITLPGTTGRLLSVVIMISGVTLFLRLAQVLFRPVKVRWRCRGCGLMRHDPDALHCKACGHPLNIPYKGE